MSVLHSDPHICQGQLCFAGRGVRIETVVARWLAGESISALARDYVIHSRIIEAGLREWLRLAVPA